MSDLGPDEMSKIGPKMILFDIKGVESGAFGEEVNMRKIPLGK
jgi:hypothetical protein